MPLPSVDPITIKSVPYQNSPGRVLFFILLIKNEVSAKLMKRSEYLAYIHFSGNSS